MRLMVAALFVALGMALGIFVLSVAAPHGPTFLIAPAIVLWFFLLIFGALMLFNRRAIRTKDYAAAIEELEREGLLEEKSFRAIRALQVEEFEDEGDHYFLELDNGAVLFLSGQYLYGYDEPRTFPCTEFYCKEAQEKRLRY